MQYFDPTKASMITNTPEGKVLVLEGEVIVDVEDVEELLEVKIVIMEKLLINIMFQTRIRECQDILRLKTREMGNKFLGNR